MSTIIKTHNEADISNIEKMIKYCSILRREFAYPYYFQFAFPTNHIDDSPIGLILDSTYFSFEVGRYPHLRQGIGRSIPVSKQVIFAPSNSIIEHNKWVACLLNDCLLNDIEARFTLDEVIANKEKIKDAIDEYLWNDLIDSANKSITSYNKDYSNQEPEPLYSYGNKEVLIRSDNI